MAQPTPYERGSRFTDFSATFPGSQQPGSHLDAEFDAVKVAIDGVLDSLKLLQRDDGKVKNRAVHADALSDAVMALILAKVPGPPGGNIMSVGLFSAIGVGVGIDVPAGTEIIHTSGRTAVGMQPAFYYDATAEVDPVTKLMPKLKERYDAATDKPAALAQLLDIQNRISVWTNGGTRFWLINESSQHTDLGHWGGDPTGVNDSSDALQAMFSWQNLLHQGTFRDRKLHVPAGQWRLDTPIIFGWGLQFNSAFVQGAGNSYDPTVSGGTTFVCTFDTHSAFNYTTNLWGGGADFALVGVAGAWIRNNSLAALDFSDVNQPKGFPARRVANGADDTDLQAWFDPARPNTDPRLRYRPYGGLCIDPFKGDRPATDGGGYPEIPVPAWAWAAEQTGTIYGKYRITTRPHFSRVSVHGFAVGCVVQPGDADGNADYVGFDNSHFADCAIAWSNGNTQMRNLHWERTQVIRAHTMFSTCKHGRQNGRLQLYCANSSVSEIIQLWDFQNGSAIVGECLFDNFTSENIWTLGPVNRGAPSTGGITFRRGNLGFHLQGGQNGERGMPRAIIWNSGDPAEPGFPARIVFDGMGFDNYDFILPFLVAGVRFIGCNPQSRYAQNPNLFLWPETARRRTSNILAGGLAFHRLDPGEPQDFYHIQMNESTVTNGTLVRSGERADWTSRNLPASLYCPSLKPKNSHVDEAIPAFREPGQYYRDGFTDTWNAATGIWAFQRGGLADIVARDGFCPGGVFVTKDGLFFWAKTVTFTGSGYAVEAQLMNGFRKDAGGSYILERPFDPLLGEFWGVSGGCFTPPTPTYFNTNTSTSLTNVQSANGVDTTVDLAVGDFIFVDNYTDPWFNDNLNVTQPSSANRITAKPAAKALTVAVAATDTVAKRRLAIAIRGA